MGSEKALNPEMIDFSVPATREWLIVWVVSNLGCIKTILRVECAYIF